MSNVIIYRHVSTLPNVKEVVGLTASPEHTYFTAGKSIYVYLATPILHDKSWCNVVRINDCTRSIQHVDIPKETVVILEDIRTTVAGIQHA